MASPRGIKVELDKERTLRFDAWAMVRLEAHTGRTFSEDAKRFTTSPATLVAFVWAGLLHAEPRLTVEQAAGRVELARIGEISRAVNQAIDQAYGIDPAKEPAPGSEGGDEGKTVAPAS